MAEKYAVVLTTINAPTRAVVQIARDAGRLGAQFILVGDSKSPADFQQPGATYLSLEDQKASASTMGRSRRTGTMPARMSATWPLSQTAPR